MLLSAMIGMIQTFVYKTEIDGNEFQHTVHSKDIETSIQKWIDLLQNLKEQVYSFDATLVSKIELKFEKMKSNETGMVI